MKNWTTLLVLSIVFLAGINVYAVEERGCELLQTYYKLSKIAVEPDGSLKLLHESLRTLCVGSPQPGSTVRYANGALATNYAAQKGATWYYSNGKLITNYAGQDGATWYWPSGKLLTNYSGQTGATVYYPNGKLATNYWGQKGATWYYDNGKLMTNYAGQVGATWYWPNGKLLSNYMGSSGATWYYDNGNLWYSSGPAVTEAELLNVPDFVATFIIDPGT